MVGGLDLAYTLSQTGAGCTTNRAAGACRGQATYLGNPDEYYMLVLFTDGTKWRQIASGRLNSGYGVISVTYCAAAAGAGRHRLTVKEALLRGLAILSDCQNWPVVRLILLRGLPPCSHLRHTNCSASIILWCQLT